MPGWRLRIGLALVILGLLLMLLNFIITIHTQYDKTGVMEKSPTGLLAAIGSECLTAQANPHDASQSARYDTEQEHFHKAFKIDQL